MVQGVPRVDEVGPLTSILVGEESALHALDVADAQPFGLLSQAGEHLWRCIHSYHPLAKRGCGQGERTRAGPEVDQGVGPVQAKVAEQGHVLGRVRACLAIIALHVLGIEMLITNVCEFVWEPKRHFHVFASPFRAVGEASSRLS